MTKSVTTEDKDEVWMFNALIKQYEIETGREVIQIEQAPDGMIEIESRKGDGSWPEWFPNNPYPAAIFPMTAVEYKKAVPDDMSRTAVSGHVGRAVWDIAVEAVMGTIRTHNAAG